MSKCIKCGASWTTPGLALCPICGAKVGAAPDAPAERLKPELSGAKVGALPGASSSRNARGTTVRIPPDGAVAAPKPAAAPRVEQKFPLVSPPADEKPTTIRTIEDRPSTARPSEEKAPPARDPSDKSSILRVPGDKPAVAKAAEDAPASADRPAGPKAEPLRVSRRLMESSVTILPVEMSPVPVPERPINGPLILGALALVTGILFPLTLVFQADRVFGVLGFCMSGFFVPFAPIAWISGLVAERRRLEQGLPPEPRVVLGRLLGQWGTLLLVAEVTAALVLIAGLRLAGKLPPTFWTPTY
jgi:hypothetical protein